MSIQTMIFSAALAVITVYSTGFVSKAALNLVHDYQVLHQPADGFAMQGIKRK